MILWPVIDQGPSQVLPLSLDSLRFLFSRTASPRAAPLRVAAENCQSRPVEPVKACAPARQTPASDGSRTAKGGTVEPARGRPTGPAIMGGGSLVREKLPVE